MILRRMIDHVKAQNWTAVALDFVIVVVGVFMGIQLGNWNEARQNRALASDYLDRLETDISTEVALWERASDYFSTAREYGRTALANYDRPVEEVGVDFLIALYQASQVWYVAPNRATYEELQSTGRIVHISDPSLRTTLSQHYLRSAQTGFTLQQSSQYRRIARLYIHQNVQAAIREHCGDQWVTDGDNFYYVKLPPTCEIDLDETLLRRQIAALHANEQVRRELQFHMSVLDANLGVIGNAQKIGEATLKKIQEAR